MFVDNALLFAVADTIQRASLPRTPEILRTRKRAMPEAMVDVLVKFSPAEPYDNIAYREFTWWIDGEKSPIVVEGDDGKVPHRRGLDRNQNEFTLRVPAGTSGEVRITDFTHLRRSASSRVERFVAGVEGLPATPEIQVEIQPVVE